MTCVRAIAVVLLSAAVAAAQSISGDLVVKVADPSQASVAGAKLILIQVQTNLKQESQTDSQGLALFLQLQPGGYELQVSSSGFQPQNVKDIRIQVGQRARVDVELQVGQLVESVSVSAAGVTLLNRESAAIGQVLDQQAIVNLPLSGRNFIQLATITSGAVPIGIGTSPASSWTGRSDMTLSIAGGRESNNSFLLNGIETRNARFGSVGVRPSIEAIQEFKVQRSTFGAEFGRSSAVVNTTMRGGTNDLHGSVFDFWQNRQMNATDFFLNRTGRAKPPLNFHNFGTAVGGPVKLPKVYDGRNRTFWFFNYEGQRQRASAAATGLYASDAQLQGNLADDSAGTGILPRGSAACQANPTSRKCADVLDPLSSGVPFPGNVIPASRLDPTTKLAVQFMPRPNVAVTPGSPTFPLFNVVGTPSQINDWDQYNLRLDHQVTPKDMIFGTFSWSNEDRDLKALRPFGGEGFPLRNRLVTTTWNRTLSPTIMNEFRFGFNRSVTYRLSETSFTKDYAKEIFNLKNIATEPIVYGIPAFNISGLSATGSISQAIGATDENMQFTDNFSVIRGKHNFRTGFQISRQAYFQVTNFSGNPSFTFDGRYSGLQTTAGVGLADFLLGVPASAGGAVGDGQQDMRSNFYGIYIQDDWRVLPNFTINAGIRYEFARSPVEIKNRSLFFSTELQRVVLAGQGVRPDIVDPDFNNWAPRFGFNWNPGFLKNFVVRGGAGIFYATDNFNEEQFKVNGPPFFQAQTLQGDARTPNLFMRDMLPSFSASPAISPFTFDRLNRTPYVSQWSFGLQKSIGNDWVVEAEYAGSTGSKLPQRRNLNAGRVDPLGSPIATRIPFPAFGPGMLITYNGGWSSYNALTAKLERRFAQGLYFLGSYTWQKSLDLGATDEFSTISTEYKKWDKGRSTFDVPHRFVSSFAYELPLGRGKKFGSGMNKAADLLVGGWQLNGILTFSQGQFQTLGLGSDWILVGSFSRSIPNVIGDPFTGRVLPDRYWNAAAFDFPRDAAGNRIRVVGNAGRNTFQQPGINNWDVSMFKNFRITERFNTQFRWETFNSLNHTQFGSANTNTQSPTFGAITGTRVTARRMQLGLKLIW